MSFFESIFYMAWRGIAIGLIISAPMGPVGMLCIQRTLDKGRRAGLFTGIGAAISDLFYSLLTGFGLSFIEDFLERNQNIIQLVGSVVLIGFGIYLFRKNPSRGLKKPVDENVSVEKSILGGFLFTFSNPLILFLIVGLFARFNFILPASPGGLHIVQYITGFIFIFVGALIWWWFITFTIDKVRSHFNIRSMWLINKIIGSIILIFAIVGIVTATSSLARGADTRCWNAQRGFGPFRDAEGNPLSNNTSDTLFFMISSDGADAVEFRSKVRNLKPSKAWGFVVSDSNGKAFVDIHSVETDFDGLSSRPALEVEGRLAGEAYAKNSFADRTNVIRRIKSGMKGPDPSGSLNFFKLVVSNGEMSLAGGLHSPESLLSMQLPEGFRPDSIGFYLAPGASITPDFIRLSSSSLSPFLTPWDDPDLLNEYLQTSLDWLEGYWQPLDRSLDETLLRLGGDYRFALVRAENGYDLIYLSGAKINPDAWRRGMLKASLRPSGIKDVWNIVWYDSMHAPLSHELKAQFDNNGTLSIQFPYQNSQLRLQRTGR